jgi:hypothetical protein
VYYGAVFEVKKEIPIELYAPPEVSPQRDDIMVESQQPVGLPLWHIYGWLPDAALRPMSFVIGGSSMLQVEETKAMIPPFGLPPSRFLPRRYKPRNVGSWSGHLAFANDLIRAIRPGLIVELGTHWGESYFTFCQTVEECGLSCLCYAVDHWRGDDHAGRYGEEVFNEVSQYNDRYYRQFSYLLRKSFDDALSQFVDESIDLLHIDGLHTYEAVSHDFRSWLPKVRKGGIILLHDISPKHQDFGVWRLWDEIKAEFPDTFEFHHSWGLGVVGKEHVARRSSLIELLFDSSPPVQEDVRRQYVIYGSHLENLLGRFPLAAGPPVPAPTLSEVRVQVFPHEDCGYSEQTCQIRKLPAGAWETLIFDLRGSAGLSPLRIDPSCEPSFIEVGDILIHSGVSGDLLWSSDSSSQKRGFAAAGTAAFPIDNEGSFLISRGDDPQIIFAAMPEIRRPVKLTVALRVTPASMQAIELFETFAARFKARVNEMEARVRALQLERDSFEAQLASIEAQLALERDSFEAQLASIEAQLSSITARAGDLAASNQEVQNSLQESQRLLRAAEATLYQMHRSLSWRTTEPVRRLMALFRSRPRITR